MTRIIFEKEGEDGHPLRLYGKDTGDLEIHVDGAWGLTFTNGVCKINLFTVAPDIEGERREVAARISMALPTLLAFRDFLVSNCEDLEKQLAERSKPAQPEPEPSAKPMRRKKE